MQGMNEYRKLAKDYDFLHPKEEIFKQKAFFQKLIKECSVKTCLDCACGTGWHLLMLNGLGLKCFGSDLSPEMLALAKKNLRGKKIRLKRQDFRKLANSWKENFDMVICMSTSFPHMLTDKDAVAALNSMYKRLNDEGF
jgi:ubiquinone/menaquinone biosynthesis C-methylase UbiE